MANLSVERLSENASSAGLTMQTMVVLQLPPSESSRMRVSFESRYGICCRSRRSVSAAITLPGGCVVVVRCCVRGARRASDWVMVHARQRRPNVARSTHSTHSTRTQTKTARHPKKTARTERGQRRVDLLALLEALAGRARDVHALAAGEVDQV